MKRKLLGIAAAMLVATYLFFCPCLNEGLYELVAIYPTREPLNVFTPYVMAGFTGEHRWIPFRDLDGKELKMHGIYFTAKPGKDRPVVLFSKGNGYCVRHLLDSKPLIILLQLGYDVFIYDYQGFGESQGSASYKKLGNDGVVAYDFLKSTMRKGKIFLYGMSMGTGVSSYIAERRSVLGVIMDSPFTTPEYTLKSWCPPLVVYPSFFFPEPHYDNEKFVTGKHPPTLILTKGQDSVTSPEQGLRLARIGTPPLESLFMPHSAHSYVAGDEEGLYTNKLAAFLSKLEQ
ncbi:MAG: alpha/beta fold hydrolase [Cyanobacteria bacterium SZAS TMP-1]|nr:alpha/beta fold hydrolase [Cyanobacteria bacterium SZAS TMP-1]